MTFYRKLKNKSATKKQTGMKLCTPLPVCLHFCLKLKPAVC